MASQMVRLKQTIVTKESKAWQLFLKMRISWSEPYETFGVFYHCYLNPALESELEGACSNRFRTLSWYRLS